MGSEGFLEAFRKMPFCGFFLIQTAFTKRGQFSFASQSICSGENQCLQNDQLFRVFWDWIFEHVWWKHMRYLTSCALAFGKQRWIVGQFCAAQLVMVSQSVSTSSRVWSCATFKEGVDQVASSAEQLEAEERELEMQIEATSLHVCFRHQVNMYMFKRLKQLRFVTFCDYFFFHPGTQKSSSSIHYFFHQCHSNNLI